MASLPRLVLAPMQDVSVLPLWRCLEQRGAPDLYVTEYFRVHRDSRPEGKILRSVLEMGATRPVVAQMIGNEPDDLVRAARDIQSLTGGASAPLAGIDVNLGCPAPKVCGKLAGGALLRDPDRIRRIVEALRPAVEGTLTLKTRIGFESADEFDDLLALFADLPLDGLAVHGRTVRERYQSVVHADRIARAVAVLPFPVTANGSIVSADTARAMHARTGAGGLMIGRGAIRNPWLFRQVRESLSGQPLFRPSLADVGAYIAELTEEVAREGNFDGETRLVQRMKKFTNYIASGLDRGVLQDRLRRARSLDEFTSICGDHLSGSAPFPLEPEEDGTLFCGFHALAGSGDTRLEPAT